MDFWGILSPASVTAMSCSILTGLVKNAACWLPPELRREKKLYRTIIQKEMPRLAYIPYDRDRKLPTTRKAIRTVHGTSVRVQSRINRHLRPIFNERKTLYADYEGYLRNELRPWAESILYDPRVEARGLFDVGFLRTLMERHCSGLEEWTVGKIAPLITYEMMLRRYYD